MTSNHEAPFDETQIQENNTGTNISKMLQVLKNNTEEEKPDFKNLLLETRNFKRVISVCQDAFENQKMIAIVGEAGLGKSKGLEYFHKTNKNVFYLTVKASMSANDYWPSFFDHVPAAERKYFGMSTRRPLYFTIKAVADLLKTYTQSLLIIDEAGKFNPRQLMFLHDVRDSTLLTTGIVLAGPPYFRRNLTRWMHSDRQGMTEVYRRINYWEELSPLDRGEIKEFARHYHVTDMEVVRRLTLECTNFGQLHNCLVEYHAGKLNV